MKKEEVKSITLVLAGTDYNKEYRASYNRYRVLLNSNIPIENAFSEAELGGLSYWSKRSQTMAMTCWGTSQSFEAQLALARWLGTLGDGKGEWGDYTQRVGKFITVL